MTHDRLITDDDVEAIAAALEKRMADKFYKDLGKGVWGVVWRTAIIILLVLAAYGAVRSAPFGVPTAVAK